MDCVPFTLFFMLCLLDFQGGSGRPQHKEQTIAWPEKCAGKIFCTIDPKFIKDYPSMETFMKALQLSDIDLAELPSPPSIDDRMAQRVCDYNLTMDPIYLIKDEADMARYTVQVPGIYQLSLRIEECVSQKSRISPDALIKCEQIQTLLPFLVLSRDMTTVETVKPLMGIPTSCSPRQYLDYEK